MTPALLSMLGSIVVAILALIGNVLTVYAGNRKLEPELDKHNAVQDERITNLTIEVRKHNGFAERIPKVETEILDLTKRVDRLEGKL